MIRKSKSGKKYYRYTIPIANELFQKAGFHETNDLKISARKGRLTITKK